MTFKGWEGGKFGRHGGAGDDVVGRTIVHRLRRAIGSREEGDVLFCESCAMQKSLVGIHPPLSQHPSLRTVRGGESQLNIYDRQRFWVCVPVIVYRRTHVLGIEDTGSVVGPVLKLA